MTAPVRIQRRRTKGWKMPEGAVYVGRPTIWGNPFTVANARIVGWDGPDSYLNEVCTIMFDNACTRKLPIVARITANIGQLRGKNLACWCPPRTKPRLTCHADLLLILANAPPECDAP